MTAVSDQLVDELVGCLAPDVILGPDVASQVMSAVEDRAPVLAATLDSPGVVSDIMETLWRGRWPDEVGCAGWWRTPLGVACAGVLSEGDRGSVTYARAAEILGLARGSIGPMVRAGDLERQDGSISRASVFARLSR